MTGLEIALFILGAAFIIISFFIVDNSSRYTRNQGASDSTVTGEAIRRIGADAIEDMNRRSDLLIAESEDKLEALSNDKIIAVGEYSDQVLEKINSNHKEVVFLYQLLPFRLCNVVAITEISAYISKCSLLLRGYTFYGLPPLPV